MTLSPGGCQSHSILTYSLILKTVLVTSPAIVPFLRMCWWRQCTAVVPACISLASPFSIHSCLFGVSWWSLVTFISVTHLLLLLRTVMDLFDSIKISLLEYFRKICMKERQVYDSELEEHDSSPFQGYCPSSSSSSSSSFAFSSIFFSSLLSSPAPLSLTILPPPLTTSF